MRISQRYSVVRKAPAKKPEGKNEENLTWKQAQNSDPSNGAETNKR